MTTDSNFPLSHDQLAACLTLARKAGAAIMDIYAQDFAILEKDDASPVTQADTLAEAILTAGLTAIAPDWPIIAEEAAAAGNIPAITGRYFWLVDPLDGTREFISKNGEFTVNIALIDKDKPIFGVIYAPALDGLYYGIKDQGAFYSADGKLAEAIACRPINAAATTIIASRRHGDTEAFARYLAAYQITDQISAGSSLKFCLLARGLADIYPRIGRTMEWDTAAGQAILEAAGGRVTTIDGAAFTYRKNAVFENPHFIAWGKE